MLKNSKYTIYYIKLSLRNLYLVRKENATESPLEINVGKSTLPCAALAKKNLASAILT